MIRTTHVITWVVVLFLVVMPVVSAAGSEQTPQLRRNGPWLVDQHGRVVLLHGVNTVWKIPPYVPPDSPGGFTAADADFLAAHGFNTVRIGTLFSGVMPEPGLIDEAYLDAWDRIVRLLADRGIWILFDFHQDMYNEKFQGEGFPDWSVIDPTTAPLPPPAFGFPFNYFSPHVSESFDNLWDNTDGVLDQLGAAWQAVADRWRDQPYSMGYDLLNEPWPGSQWSTCANLLGCPISDAQTLQPAWEHLTAAIREVDSDNLVWWEPYLLFDFGAPTYLADASDPQVGLSWHNYCLPGLAAYPFGFEDVFGCAYEENLVFRNAASAADAIGSTQLLTEFGSTDDVADVARVVRLADDHLVGWQYWHYKGWSDPTTVESDLGGQSLFADDADLASLKPDKARVLVRTYPMATAGTPVDLDFDPETGEFSYRYSPSVVGAPTEIFTSPLHYPDGYVVSITGGTVTSPTDARIVTIEADESVASVVVAISAKPSPGEATPPGASSGPPSEGSTPGTGGGAGVFALVSVLGVALFVRRERHHRRRVRADHVRT